MKWLSVFALFLALVAAENPEGRLICICCVELAYILTGKRVSIRLLAESHQAAKKNENRSFGSIATLLIV